MAEVSTFIRVGAMSSGKGSAKMPSIGKKDTSEDDNDIVHATVKACMYMSRIKYWQGLGTPPYYNKKTN